MLKLRLINDAQERGATWAEIARALGYASAKALKNEVKVTARRLQRELWAEAETGVTGGVN
jgi:transposase-like protein